MEHKCHFCGSILRVDAPELRGHMESEEYYCPECRTEYRTRASNTPSVTVVNGRTDGRTINIYEFEKIQKEIQELQEKVTKKEN